MKCEHCLPQLLPFVYDLLEADERASVAAHLEQCPSCPEALKTAREQAGLLAEAVKDHNSDIVFKAPEQRSVSSSAPTAAMPRPRRPIFLLNRWSIAASLLLAFFSIGGLIGWNIWRDGATQLDEAKDRLAKARQDLSKSQQDWSQQKGQTQKEIRAIQEQINQLFNDWRSEENKRRKVSDKDRAMLLVNGPVVAVAGAPNNYKVQMLQQDALGVINTAHAPGMAFKGGQQQALPGLPNQKLQVRAVDKNTHKTLYERDLVTKQDGSASFVLPSDIPFKPGDDIVLVFETRSPDGKLVKLGDSLKLVFPEYVTHLTTDRPLYRPGETVRFRSLTLERFSLKPAGQPLHLRFRIVGPDNEEHFRTDVASDRLIDAKNEPIKGPQGEPLHGVGVGEFRLPVNLQGGQYTLSVSEVNDRFHEEKRTFLVHPSQPSRLNKEVQFHRTSYGAGDLVRVQLKVVQGPAMGGMSRNVQVIAKANVDDQEVPINNPQNNFTDDNGVIAFTFTLPPQIFKGTGSVTFSCDDAGIKETVRRTIPIVVNNLELDFYPEGGDLITGVPNRVYFQARTPANGPADVEATLLEEQTNRVVARFKMLTDDAEPGINQGLGSFTFTPRPKEKYKVRIDSPIGIDRSYALPPIKEKGLVMTIPKGVVEDEIGVTLYSVKQPRELLVGAYCRGRMLDYKIVQAAADVPTEVTLKPQSDVGGVYRVTVFEKLKVAGNLVYRELAERLIYRKNAAKVEVAVEAKQPFYQPGESVRLSLRALNEKKEFVPAFAMIAVVDQSVLKLADEKTARTMPTHFLLTTEVRNPEDLENADVLLGMHPKAAQALDLLLGCQGWRRFAEQDPERFQRRLQQSKPPVFVANANPVSHSLDAEQQLIEKVDQNFVTKAIELEKTLAAKEKQEAEGPQGQKQVKQSEALQQAAEVAKLQAEDHLRDLGIFYVQFVMGGALLTLLFIGFFFISVGLRRLAEGEPARSWLVIGIALLGMLFLISVVGTFVFMGENLLDNGRNAGRGMFQPGGVKMGGGPPAVDVGDVMARPANPENVLDDEPEADPEPEPEAQPAKSKGRGPKKAPAPVPQDFAANNLAVNNQNFNPNKNWPANDAKNDFFLNPDERELRKQGKYQALLQNQLGRRVQLPPVEDVCLVREYAHVHRPRKDKTRRDFAETVYWHPILVMPDGKAEVKFDLSDSVTRFQVLVFSHTADGRLGANRIEIASKLPFSIDPKTPIEVTNTDKILVPVFLSNQRPTETDGTLSVRTKGLTVKGLADPGVKLKPNATGREVFEVEPNIVEGTAILRVAGRTTNATDAVERRIKIVQEGFPISGSVGGVLENGSAEHSINLPDAWLPGSLQVEAKFYPSPIAELQAALVAMQREPAGSFEQSASRKYPNVMILEYMKAAGQINATFQPNPALEKRSRQMLQADYESLTRFECIDPQKAGAKRGFDWFGPTAAPDEALTAFALMQFRDMARLYPVDDAMLGRTEKYLLDQRDGKGGFKRNAKGVGPVSDAVRNAYVLWALSGGAPKETLDVELAAARASCKESKDPYQLALAALAHLNRGLPVEGAEILRDLAALQKPDGELAGASASITGSQGRDLLVESTALAVLGWLKAERGEFKPHIDSAVKWLGQQRRGAGGFGATQATVLALKALIAHAEKFPRAMQGGEVTMLVRETRAQAAAPVNNFAAPGVRFAAVGPGLPEANRAFFSPRSHDPIVLSLRDTSVLSPGKNVIQLSTQGQGQLPYTLTWSYRTLKPASDPKAPVQLKTSLNKENAKEGDIVKLRAGIENVSGQRQGMAVAVIGLPGGLTVPEDFEQLKAYAQMHDGGAKINAWELRGRELVLYWRDLAPGAKVDLEIDLLCRLPGRYRGPASRAYLYYDDEHKYWIESLMIQIEPAPQSP